MRFRDIKGFEGFYQVSDTGVVRSVDKEVKQRNGGLQMKRGKVLSPAITRDGYVQCALSKDNKLTAKTVHRLVAIAFIPNPKRYREVNHKDCNKQNNNFKNLEWCSREHNIRHAVKNNRIHFYSGDDHPRKVFKDKQYESIKILHDYGLTVSQISDQYNCHFTTVSKFLNSKL